MGRSSRKIDAIFEVRAAAEKKALAEKALDDDPGMEKRDQLLEARLTLEEKTIAAIEICHDCGHANGADQPHQT
jgi:hypothetical protein